MALFHVRSHFRYIDLIWILLTTPGLFHLPRSSCKKRSISLTTCNVFFKFSKASSILPCHPSSSDLIVTVTVFVPPFTGWSFSMGSAYQFHSWRVFVVVCALPCVCAVVALTFMPESPRFYLEVNRFQLTVFTLKLIRFLLSPLLSCISEECRIVLLCHCRQLCLFIYFPFSISRR